MFEKGAALFDALRSFWKTPAVQRRIFLALVVLFIATGIAVVLKRAGWLPAIFDTLISDSPFAAIHLAFSLVLALEVVALVFAVADSVSRAVGKQLEIMALILLRDTFNDIGLLHNPLLVFEDYNVLIQVFATSIGALLLFVCLGFYVKIRRLHGYIKDEKERAKYVNTKKCVALAMFIIVVAIGGYDLFVVLVQGKPTNFFFAFYNTLIFFDILLVLVSQYYMPSFHATFRNSGYAVGTLIMRIALSAEQHYVSAGLCVFAAVYLLALTWATSRFPPPAVKISSGYGEPMENDPPLDDMR